MNSKVKVILGIVLFALFMGGAYYAYHTLSEKNKPDLTGLSKSRKDPLSPTGSPDMPAEISPAATGSGESKPDVTPGATGGGESKPDVTPAVTEAPAEEGGSQDETEDKLAAIDFTVYDAQGNEIKLSDFYGKPIIINFWATWCPYCVEEMPVFEEAYRKYGDDIHFLMIDDVDGQRETQAKGERFIQEKGFTFPVYYDTEGFAGYTYQVYSLPTSVFIDSEGYIVIYYPGQLTAEMLQRGIDYVLAGSEG
jgi:thiol-disulfide isomerase/thioredoxin